MRVFLHLHFVILFLIGIVFAVNAQTDNHPDGHNSCISDKIRAGMIAKDPTYLSKEQQFNEKIYQMTIAKKNQSNLRTTLVDASNPCTIPVVFHIVVPEGQTLNTFMPDVENRVSKSVEWLNNAFAGQAPYGGENSNIRFVLARQNINQQYTSGITQITSSYSNLNAVGSGTDLAGFDDGIINAVEAQNSSPNFLFPNDKYINIFIVNSITENDGTTPAGYAYLPVSNPDLISDAIIVNKDYFGNTVRNNVVMIHEMGHFLGLLHTFQGINSPLACVNNNCLNDGDKVCDTPPDATNSPGSNCNSNDPANNGCGYVGADLNKLINNYMDYGDATCKNVFTQGQVDRMVNTLNSVRAGLCGSIGTLTLCPKPVLSFNVVIDNVTTSNQARIFPDLQLVNGVTSKSGFNYEVDFGDGTTVTLYDATSYSTTIPITHSYANGKTYTITVTLKYRTSPAAAFLPECTMKTTKSFTSKCPFTAPSFTASKTIVDPNESVTFTNTTTCPVTGGCSYSWLKDGQSFSSDPATATNQISSTTGVNQVQLQMTYSGCTVKSEGVAIQVGGNLCMIDKRYSKFTWTGDTKAWSYTGNTLVSQDLNANMNLGEATSIICDKYSGEILFYTDGMNIYGRDNQIIQGGTGVFSGTDYRGSADRGNIILQNPLQSNLYYFFSAPGVESYQSLGAAGSNADLHYVTVDINQGNIVGGKKMGQVIAGPIPLLENAPEKIAVTSKVDGSGYFLITHELGGTRFVTFEITGNGVDPTKHYSSGVTNLNLPASDGSNAKDAISGMTINQQGTQLAILYGDQYKAEIYQYDAITGTVVNNGLWATINIPFTQISFREAYQIQFSPNGKKLYITSENGGIFIQYDLEAADVQNSVIIFPNIMDGLSIMGQMLTTPDGHLIVSSLFDKKLYEIKIPNASAANNECELQVIATGISAGWYGLSTAPIDLTQGYKFPISGSACVKPGIKGSIYGLLNVPVSSLNSYQWSINQGNPPLASIVGSSTSSFVTLDFSYQSGTVELQCQVTSPCGVDIIKKTITINNSCGGPACTIKITTANNEPTVLIPTCHPSVTLNASNGFASYQWKTVTTDISGATTATPISGATNSIYVANTGGVYIVTGVDINGCVATSTSITVIDGLTITGNDNICPGQKASLQVNIAGVQGDYYVQWVQNGGVSTSQPSGTQGDYYAMVVLPTFAGCTLTTAPKAVQLLPAPSPYTVSTDKKLLCLNAATLTATAPTSSAVPITNNVWSNGSPFAGMPATSTLNNVTAGGSYFVTSSSANGCTAISNVVYLVTPMVTINQRCTSGGIGTELIADHNIPGSSYAWKNASGTVLATTQSYIPTVVGTYTVTTTATLCPVTASTVVCTQPAANLGTNLVTRGDFNIAGVASPVCTNYPVSSDLTCSDATTTPLNSGTWPSNFKITSNAGPENLNKWSGTGYSDPTKPTENYCLIADGRVTLSDERVWFQQVAVENCATYTFRALIDNIIINEAEIPRVWLKIKNGTTNSFIKGTTVFASQANWVELSGTWKSPVTGTVEISIMLEGGGFVGRDIAVDEIYFAKTNCSSLNDFRPGRSCTAVTSMGMDKYICSGQSAQIGMNAATDPNLTYSWTAPGFSSTAANPTVTPTVTNTYKLVVTDNVNNCTATDYVTVTVIVPEITITKDITTGCATQVKANLFSGISNPQYEWWVNGVATTTNTTGVFSLTGLATGTTVKCRLVTACASNVYSNTITVGNTAPVTATNTTICSGTSTQLHANMSGGTAPFTYTWTASTGTVPSAVADPMVSPTATTTYSLTFKDANNCTFTGNVTVNVNALPQAVTVSPAAGCVGTSKDYTITYGTGNTVTSAQYPSMLSISGGQSYIGYYKITANSSVAGTDNFVFVTTSSQGCARTTTLPFTAYVPPTPVTITVSKTPACIGDQVAVTVMYGSGTFLGISTPAMYSIINANNITGGFIQSYSVTSVGTGTVDGISQSGAGCYTTVSVPVSVTPNPSVPITSTGTLICSGSPILLSTTSTGTAFQWYRGATLITGATNASYSTAVAGTYTMKLTDANTCSNTSTGIALTTSNLAAPRVHVDDATDTYCASLPLSMNVGTTLQLNGTNQYVNVSGFNYPASGSGLPNGGPITVEFWIKSNGSYNSAFSLGGLDNPNRAVGIVPHTDGNLYWDYGYSSGSGRVSYPFTSYVNKWTHVALVSAGKGGNFKAIYLNGTLVASGAVSDGPNVALSGLTIGKWLTTYAGGKIDEFRIWNKVLSAAEIQAAMTGLYEAGTPNLMGSWGFDEASGTTVNNDAFFAQTGTMMNSATRAPGTANLTYTWSPSAYLNTSTGMSVIPNTAVVRTYTVKGVDANGCSAYAHVVATPISTCKDGPDGVALVEEVKSDWDVDVYPNPTEGDVHISFVNVTDDTDLSLEVVGMDGAIVFDIAHISVNEICNLKELPSGLYLIRAKKGEQVKIKKVLVVK